MYLDNICTYFCLFLFVTCLDIIIISKLEKPSKINKFNNISTKFNTNWRD